MQMRRSHKCSCWVVHTPASSPTLRCALKQNNLGQNTTGNTRYINMTMLHKAMNKTWTNGMCQSSFLVTGFQRPVNRTGSSQDELTLRQVHTHFKSLFTSKTIQISVSHEPESKLYRFQVKKLTKEFRLNARRGTVPEDHYWKSNSVRMTNGKPKKGTVVYIQLKHDTFKEA